MAPVARGLPGRSRSVAARLALLAALVLAVGCAGGPSEAEPEEPSPSRTALLQHELAALSEKADASESQLLAEAAIRYSRALAAEYRLAHPPVLHNLLVNLGLRERGLCWHWTEDLLERLGELPLPSYQLHWGIAHRGKLFREHNSVVVTTRGGEFASGIVLDAWRDSGELYWAPVVRDSYPWEPYGRGLSGGPLTPRGSDLPKPKLPDDR